MARRHGPKPPGSQPGKVAGATCRKEVKHMYSKISIKIGATTIHLKTLDHDTIYRFLVDHGYTHCDAAEVADWAELAAIGEEYDLPGAEIVIEE